jgi:hypothetical protein
MITSLSVNRAKSGGLLLSVEADQATIHALIAAALADKPVPSPITPRLQPSAKPVSHKPKRKKAAAAKTVRKKCRFCANHFEGYPSQRYCSERCKQRIRSLPQRPAANGQDRDRAGASEGIESNA